MREVDVRAQGFFPPAHFLQHVFARVHDELQLERSNSAAGVAGTRCPGIDELPATPKRDVRVLDDLEKCFATSQRPVGEDSVPLDVLEVKRGDECSDDLADEVREDLVRVIQLGLGEVAVKPEMSARTR